MKEKIYEVIDCRNMSIPLIADMLMNNEFFKQEIIEIGRSKQSKLSCESNLIIRLYQEGMSIRSICKKIKVGHQRVSQILKNNQIKIRYSKKGEIKKEDILYLYKNRTRIKKMVSKEEIRLWKIWQFYDKYGFFPFEKERI